MPAAIHNFSIEQGSDFQITFQYLNTDLSPVALSGAETCVSFLYKPIAVLSDGIPTNFPSEILTSKMPTPTGYRAFGKLTADNSGNIVLDLKYKYTKMLAWDSAAYDLYVTDTAAPSKYRLATGSISLIKNNFQECLTSASGVCIECEDAEAQKDNPNPNPSPSPSPGSSVPGTTPTPTPTPASIGSEVDLCSFVCNDLDMYSQLYSSSGIIRISSVPIVEGGSYSVSHSTINVATAGAVENIDVLINKLKYPYPQDLAFVLTCPTGHPILLSSHNKIINNNTTTGFSFAISNKAAAGSYINNSSAAGNYVNIIDKTNTYRSGKNIISSTQATPVVVTLPKHGYLTGDVVEISNHATNTTANGIWAITKINDDSFSLSTSRVCSFASAQNVLDLRIVLTGNTASGSYIITNIGSTSSLEPGMRIAGAGINEYASIVSVNSASQIALSHAASATATSTSLTFTPFTVGLGIGMIASGTNISTSAITSVSASSVNVASNTTGAGPQTIAFNVSGVAVGGATGRVNHMVANLDAITGIVPSGNWRLSVYNDDLQPGATGTIDNWSLVIAYAPPAFTVEST